MYTVSTTPGGRTDTADTIPDAMAAFASQLTAQLPVGPVAWSITDPDSTEHRGRATLGSRIEQLTTFVDELVDDLYTALHRAADRPSPASLCLEFGRRGPRPSVCAPTVRVTHNLHRRRQP